MFFFRSFLFFLSFNFNFCIFSQCCGSEPELIKKQLDNYIDLSNVEQISTDKPFYYILKPESVEEGKKRIVSITIKESKLNSENELKDVTKTLKLEFDDEFLNCLCIMNVAIGYYILFVCCNDNKYYFFNKNMYKDELELSTGNELTKEKLVEIIEDLNKSPFNNDTLRIQSISGLKIYKEPIAIFSQKMI
jgi:hypothetical protein